MYVSMAILGEKQREVGAKREVFSHALCHFHLQNTECVGEKNDNLITKVAPNSP